MSCGWKIQIQVGVFLQSGVVRNSCQLKRSHLYTGVTSAALTLPELPPVKPRDWREC